MDSYRIGVSIALANGVSPVLAVISRDLLGIRAPIGQITAQFAQWNQRLIGVAGVLGGTAIIGGLMKIAEHGDKILDQQDKLQRAGLLYADVLKLQSDYYGKIAKAVPTSTASDFLKNVGELRAVTGSTDEAAALAPKALMVDTLLSNALGREVHGEYYKLLRSAEMKGISTDPGKLQQFTDQIFSYVTAFGGKLSAEDFQTLARRGGTAFMNAKPEAIGPLAVLAADLGGSAAGTTLMTLQQLQQGANTLTKQQGQTLGDLGLIDMSKATQTGFGGSRLQLAPGAMKGALEHVGDLPGWIKDTVYPALKEASHGDEAILQSLIAKISPNRNAAKLIEMFGNPKFLDQQGKDLGLARQVEPIPDAYKHFIERSPLGVKQAFNKQYASMLQAIGAPMMQAALPVMREVTAMFSTMGQFANSHPEAIKLIAEGIAALGVALGAAGIATLVALGGVPAIVTGLVAAVGSLIALNWGAVTGWLMTIPTAINSAVNGIVGGMNKLIDFLMGIAGKIAGFFTNGAGSAAGPDGQSSPGDKKGAEEFRKNLEDANKTYTPIRFDPGRGGRGAQPISLSLNVDGRTLARVMSDLLEDMSTFPSGGGSGNGVQSWASQGNRA